MPFTKENAAEMAKLSHIARMTPKPASESAYSLRETSTNGMQDSNESFRETALNRVRGHITRVQDKLDSYLDKARYDPKDIADLAAALTKLEGIEQKLSNRANPGSLRPTAKPARVRSVPDPQPEPE